MVNKLSILDFIDNQREVTKRTCDLEGIYLGVQNMLQDIAYATGVDYLGAFYDNVDFIRHDSVMDYVMESVDENDFKDLFNITNGIKELDTLYKINGYGNLENVSRDYVCDTLHNFIKETLEDLAEDYKDN